MYSLWVSYMYEMCFDPIWPLSFQFLDPPQPFLLTPFNPLRSIIAIHTCIHGPAATHRSMINLSATTTSMKTDDCPSSHQLPIAPHYLVQLWCRKLQLQCVWNGPEVTVLPQFSPTSSLCNLLIAFPWCYKPWVDLTRCPTSLPNIAELLIAVKWLQLC